MATLRIEIVGQGIAGTLLGWACAAAGIDFRVWDPGSANSASAVSGGLINPVTGQRFVPSWRLTECWPVAREVYRDLETCLGVPLWRELRVCRRLRNAAERDALARKRASGALAPWLQFADAEASATWPDADVAWFAPAAAVDVATLLAASRVRWLAEGRLVERSLGPAEAAAMAAGGGTAHRTIALWCLGAALRELWPRPEWQVARGELIEVATKVIDPAVVRSDGHFALPVGEARVRVGATYTPGATDLRPSEAARAELHTAARRLLEAECDVVAHRVGLRLATGTGARQPVAAWRAAGREGVLGALGSKGVLHAPWLARLWVEELLRVRDGAPARDPVSMTNA